jgi:hypothetical protein
MADQAAGRMAEAADGGVQHGVRHTGRQLLARRALAGMK